MLNNSKITILMILIAAILLGGCGKPAEELTDSARQEASPPYINTLINQYKEIPGSGNLIVNFTMFGEAQISQNFTLIDPNTWDDAITLNARYSFVIENVAAATGYSPGDTLIIGTADDDWMGASAKASWEFPVPDTDTNIVYEDFRFAPNKHIALNSYVDISTLDITDNAAIDWDFQSTDESWPTTSFTANTGCGLYIVSGSALNHTIDPARFQSSVTLNTDIWAEIVFKTKEGNYGHMYFSSSGPDYVIYYYNDGSNVLYEPPGY